MLLLPMVSGCHRRPALPPDDLAPTQQQGLNHDGFDSPPALDDFWDGRAVFVVDVVDTGLPMGESDSVLMPGGRLWSFVHASTASAGVRDRFGRPVPFPGCVVAYESSDGGRFYRLTTPTCLFSCVDYACSSTQDHIDQQQYPRVAYDGRTYLLVYEYRGRVRLRRSPDGLTWSEPERVADTGIWQRWPPACPEEMRIGPHPYTSSPYTCLNGGPPGIYVEDGRVYVFVALGQNPGHIGCYVGSATTPARRYVPCSGNPLFAGASSYGPAAATGAEANAFFDFRTISSAEVIRQGRRVYMFYEGVRGAGPGDDGDTQFGLGLARTVSASVDGPWEVWAQNPLLVDLPGNVGLGHADLIVQDGVTYLYTSLDGTVRSRLALVWR
jgi:hypothetical protein